MKFDQVLSEYTISLHKFKKYFCNIINQVIKEKGLVGKVKLYSIAVEEEYPESNEYSLYCVFTDAEENVDEQYFYPAIDEKTFKDDVAEYLDEIN